MPMETDSNAEGAMDSESCDSDAAPVWHTTDEDMERESVPDWTYENNPCCYYMPTIAVVLLSCMYVLFCVAFYCGTCITDSSTVIMFSTFLKTTKSQF